MRPVSGNLWNLTPVGAHSRPSSFLAISSSIMSELSYSSRWPLEPVTVTLWPWGHFLGLRWKFNKFCKFTKIVHDFHITFHMMWHLVCGIDRKHRHVATGQLRNRCLPDFLGFADLHWYFFWRYLSQVLSTTYNNTFREGNLYCKNPLKMCQSSIQFTQEV